MSRPLGSAADLERRRRMAVQRVREGEPPTQVARDLGIDRSSLFRWCRAEGRDPDGLAARPHGGPAARLSKLQMLELQALLLQGARCHGWPDEAWTATRVAALIHGRFGVSYHPDHVRRLLRHMDQPVPDSRVLPCERPKGETTCAATFAQGA
jgi:transposase